MKDKTPKIIAKVTYLKDSAAIKRYKNQLTRINKSLEKYKSVMLMPNGYNVNHAKEFVKLMAERDKLSWKLEEAQTSKDAIRIQLSTKSKDNLPAGFEDFTVTASSYSQESLAVKEKKRYVGSVSLRTFITAHRSPDRSIYIRSTHSDIEFCLVIANNGGEIKFFTF
jgi:hypothetical protein